MHENADAAAHQGASGSSSSGINPAPPQREVRGTAPKRSAVEAEGEEQGAPHKIQRFPLDSTHIDSGGAPHKIQRFPLDSPHIDFDSMFHPGDEHDDDNDVNMDANGVNSIQKQTHDVNNKNGNKPNGDDSKSNINKNILTLFYKKVQQHHHAYINALQSNLVTEVHSLPRVVKFATKHKLQPGYSIDIQRHDENGQPSDLNNNNVRNKLINLIAKTKPALVVGSPMCTMFSSLQNLNKNKRDEH